MSIYFARHGKTEYGEEHRLEGVSDSELTDEGKKQAGRLGLFLKDRNIKKIISSPLKRSRQTAAIVSGLTGADMNIDETWREMSYGAWDGKKKEDKVEYDVPGKRGLWVQKGDTIQKGQQLCEGNLDLKELFKTVGKDQTQKYIIQEVQRIYTSQGASIHDKHIETITRQMFSRVRVKDAGDSKFSEGEIIERAREQGRK